MLYIGVPNGQVVFRGFDPAGRALVQTRTTKYTLPAGIRDPKAIKAWVARQVQTGGIGTQLYPKQRDYDSKRVAAAQKRVAKTLDSRFVWHHQVVALNSELNNLKGAERAALVNGLAKDSPKRLDRWISEAISPGWGPFGGLSPKQRKELFSALVKDQDPKDLRTIAKAAGSQGKMSEFVQAVAKEGSREQHQGLFIQLAKDARPGAKDAERSRAELYNTLGKPKVVFDGRDGAGQVRVRMLGSRYTLPGRANDSAVAIKRWVGSVETGGIAKPAATKGKAYDASKVSAAYQSFGKTLGGIGFGARDRVIRLNNQLEALNGAERQALVNLLATARGGRQTLLEQWIVSGVGDYGAFRGRNKEFFGALVKGQDPANLNRIAKASIKLDKQIEQQRPRDARRTSEFMQAVAQHGTWQQRHGLFKSLVDNAKRGTPGAARVMAELFAGLRNRREVDAAFTALDRPATDAMVAASLDSNLKAHDHSLFRRMAKSASLSRSATEKASFVAASGPSLLNNAGGESVRRDRLKALSHLIRSDASGVIDSTLNQYATRGSSSGRRAIYNFIEGLYDSDDPEMYKEAEAILISLQRGPNTSTNPHDWLNVKSRRNAEEPAYHHARLLGAYVGIVSNVAGKRDRHRNFWAPGAYIAAATGLDATKESAGWLGDRFAKLGFLGTAKGKAIIGISVVVAKAIVASRLLFWRSDTQKDEGSFGARLQRLAMPIHEKTGAAATAPWVTTYGESFSRNRIID